METEEICAELDRQGVTGHFKIRGADEEIGPRDLAMDARPTPRRGNCGNREDSRRRHKRESCTETTIAIVLDRE